MASKRVTDRQKSAEAVLAIGRAQRHAIRALAPVAATQSVAAGKKVKQGEAPADAGLLEELSAQLLAARDAMIDADEEHERELADDPAAREARDASAANLTNRLTEVREMVTGIYGPTAAQQVMPGRTPQDPVVIARFAGEVASQLRAVALPEPRIRGAVLDAQAIATELETARRELEARLEAVARELREHDATLVKKNRAIAEYDRAFQGVANVLTGLFLLAGQDDLADRVRPSSRKPGRVAVDDGGDDAETELPGVTSVGA